VTFVENLSDITFDAEGEDGDLVRRTLHTRTWTDGGWATVMILFDERAKDKTTWRQPKLALIRMRRAGDGWKKQSAVTLPAAHATALRGELIGLEDRLAVPFDQGRDDDDA
jgi:hypothetical protein